MDTPRVSKKHRAGKQATYPPLSDKTKRTVRIGVTFALVCAAAMSAPTLYQLAHRIGYAWYLAWLLPAALDGYAYTSIRFGSQVPAGHPARDAASKNARLALCLTVGANAVYHLIVLAGLLIPTWVPIFLLVVVSSLPPYIVHRLLHLHALAHGDDGDSLPTAEQVPAKQHQSSTRPPTKPVGTADEPPTRTATADDSTTSGDADVIEFGTAGAAVRRNTAVWAKDALPLYQRYIRLHGEPPKAPQLAAELERAGYGTLKPSRARDIRKATAELSNEVGEVEPERAAATTP